MIVQRSICKEQQIPYINTHMWNLENGMDDLIGKAETETHQLDTKGKGGGMNWGTGIDIYTQLMLCVK